MPNTKPPTPDPASQPTSSGGPDKKEAAQQAQLAGLAARLLASGEALADRRDQIAAAVRAARILTEETQKPVHKHACDIFQPHQVLSVKDIGKIFDEHDWPKLGSEGSARNRAIEILTALHHDIQRRSNLLSSAFQQLRRNISPDDAEREATRSIRELLERLGMSSAFGEGLTQTVSNTWQKLLDVWLRRVLSVRDQMERTKDHTPEYFEKVCPDLYYSDFCASQKPEKGLCSDDLLNLGLWLYQDLRKRLENGGRVTPQELDGMETLNRWPEWLFPDEPHLARPFAAFLATIRAGDAATTDDIENLDRGIGRLSLLISRMRLKELFGLICQPAEIQAPRKNKRTKRPKIVEADGEQKPSVDPLVRLQEIRAQWWALSSEGRTSLDDRFINDPVVMIDTATAFLTDGRHVSGMHSLPFSGGHVRNPLLRTYATNLDTLHRCLEDLERLSGCLGFEDKGLMPVTQSIRQEIDKLRDLANLLNNAGNAGSKQRQDKGQHLLEKMVFSAPSPGRLRPYLLFAYARDSQSLKDPKLKDLLYHRLAT